MIDVEISYAENMGEFPLDRYQELIHFVCKTFSLAQATVNVAILDDETMIQLNRKYKDLDGTTDCFSFDLSEGAGENQFEILVNGQLAQREAQARGHEPDAELALYLTHGLLHNLGYDDLIEEEAAKMHAREDEILQCFGYGVVYNRARQDR